MEESSAAKSSICMNSIPQLKPFLGLYPKVNDWKQRSVQYQIIVANTASSIFHRPLNHRSDLAIDHNIIASHVVSTL